MRRASETTVELLSKDWRLTAQYAKEAIKVLFTDERSIAPLMLRDILTSLGSRLVKTLPQLGLALVLGPCLAFLFMFAICLHVDKVMPQYEQQAKARQEIAG